MSPPVGKNQLPPDVLPQPIPGPEISALVATEPLPFVPTLVSGPSGGVGLAGVTNSHSAVIANGLDRGHGGGAKSSAEATAGTNVRQKAHRTNESLARSMFVTPSRLDW